MANKESQDFKVSVFAGEKHEYGSIETALFIIGNMYIMMHYVPKFDVFVLLKQMKHVILSFVILYCFFSHCNKHNKDTDDDQDGKKNREISKKETCYYMVPILYLIQPEPVLINIITSFCR